MHSCMDVIKMINMIHAAYQKKYNMIYLLVI